MILRITKVSLLALLDAAHTQTVDYLKALDDSALSRIITTPWGPIYRLVEMIGHLIEHEIHHRAELSLIPGNARARGVECVTYWHFVHYNMGESKGLFG